MKKELSLRPYHGRLFVTTTADEYQREHKRVFKTPDVLTCATSGRFTGGEGSYSFAAISSADTR